MKKEMHVHYVWSLSDENDKRIYAVEYRGEVGHVGHLLWEELDLLERKARRMAFELTGNRKAMLRVNDGFSPYEGGHEIVRVPFGTKPLAASKIRQRPIVHEYDNGDEYDWENFLESVQDRMGYKKNGEFRRYWRIDGKNIDWRGRDGSKYARAEDADELLRAIYHEGLIRLYAGKKRGTFELNAPTHDTPMGSWYVFSPVSEKEYEANA